MAVLKCKMCGSPLDITQAGLVCECEYCGTKQTIPANKSEDLLALFDRATTLRRKCEFDKAEAIYEKIIENNSTESEAYWGLILCKYGIEYVDDPATLKKIPTCHRTSYDAIVTDDNYKLALQYADAIQRSIYESDAKTIDEIQKGILAISSQEEPYDVFICYKETDENGKRTQDSVLANDIYYQLQNEGYKVFYAAITLEDKLGSQYEPVIFAALNSAKVMLAIGTKPAYFNAVWVKNEWSRFLKMMKNDRSKLLIPCYRDMDAYELPEEFAHLQAQDMSKIGFVNDVVRGIKKVIVKKQDTPAPAQAPQQMPQANSAAPLVERAYSYLNVAQYDKANEIFEKALDIEPSNEKALLGKLLVEYKVKNIEALANGTRLFNNSINYSILVNACGDKTKKELDVALAKVNDNIIRKAEDCLQARDWSTASNLYNDALNYNPKNEKLLLGKLLVSLRVTSIDEMVEANPAFDKSPAYKELIKHCSEETKKELEDARNGYRDAVLQKADKALQEGNYSSAKKYYQILAKNEPNNEKLFLGILLADCSASSIAKLGEGTVLFQDKESYANLYNVCSDKMKEDLAEVIMAIEERLYENAEAQLKAKDFDGAYISLDYLKIYLPDNENVLLCMLLAKNKATSLEELGLGTTKIEGTPLYNELLSVCEEETKAKLQKCSRAIEASIKMVEDKKIAEEKKIKKQKQKKTLILVSIIAVVLISAVLVTVILMTSNKFIYKVEKTSVTVDGEVITGYVINGYRIKPTGKDGAFKIPAEIGGVPVIGIGARAFERNIYDSSKVDFANFNSIIVPENVIFIGEYAFRGQYIDYITLPNTLREIRNGAFEGTSGLYGQYFSIDLPSNLTSIGYRAFADSRLSGITIPDSVTTIGTYAFAGSSLSSATLPNNMTGISEGMFENCYNFTSIDIPSTVKVIGHHAFEYTILSDVEIPDSVTSIGDYAFNGTNLENVVIPDSVTYIGEYAFENTMYLTSIAIGSGVTTVGANAVCIGNITEITASADVLNMLKEKNESQGYNALKKVVINGGKKIGDNLFSVCTDLEVAEIKEGVEIIGESAFSSCSNLHDIYIPKTLTLIENQAFSNTNIFTVYYSGTEEQWNNITMDGIYSDPLTSGYNGGPAFYPNN